MVRLYRPAPVVSTGSSTLMNLMKTKANKAPTWIIAPLLSLGLAGFSCQAPSNQVPAPLPVNFDLTGQYALVAIQIDPPLREGQDVMAMYADSSGQSPCLRGATIRFDAAGWLSLTTPVGCEQNDDLTEITGLQNGGQWSLQDDRLLIESLSQTTEYGLKTNGDHVFLSLDIDKDYASSLDDNPPGFTLTIELKRL